MISCNIIIYKFWSRALRNIFVPTTPTCVQAEKKNLYEHQLVPYVHESALLRSVLVSGSLVQKERKEVANFKNRFLFQEKKGM